jgi:hypothetical protein
MKVTDIIASRSDDDAPYYTFEVSQLDGDIDKLPTDSLNLYCRSSRLKRHRELRIYSPEWIE